MGSEIAITVAREETRVAVLDGGVVTDLFGDRTQYKNSVAVKSLLGQLDRQIKKLVDKGEAAVQRDRPTELLKNLLFYVAQSKAGGVRVSELKKAFRLDELLPDAGDLSRAQSDCSAPARESWKTSPPRSRKTCCR